MDVTSLAGTAASAHTHVTLTGARERNDRQAGVDPLQVEADAARVRAAQVAAAAADARLASQRQAEAGSIVA